MRNFNLTADDNLMKRMLDEGIIYINEDDGSGRDMYEECNEYLFHNDKYIVTIYSCNVLDSELLIYDINTLNLIASQYLRPQGHYERFNYNKWGSILYNNKEEQEDDDIVFEELMKEDRQSPHYEQYEIDYERF